MAGIAAVIFDVGNVLYHWDPRFLYERLIADDRALDAFLRDVVTQEWHFQHDAGRDFADTSAELIARHPDHADLIRLWGPRFNETVHAPVEGMAQIVAELSARAVPLYAITNFSHEFWPPFRQAQAALFDHFQDIVVSGVEKLVKPQPEIYHLSLARFGVAASDALFIDDRLDNVAAARAVGLRTHHFRDAAALRSELAALGLLDNPEP